MDGIIAGAIAIGSLIPIIRLQKDISSLESTIREMRGIPIMSPNALLHHLKSGTSAALNHFQPKTSSSSISEAINNSRTASTSSLEPGTSIANGKDDEIISGKVFLQGIIDAKYPVNSLLDNRPLVYRDFYVENIYSNQRSLSQSTLHSKKRKLFEFPTKPTDQMVTSSAPYMDLLDYQDFKQQAPISSIVLPGITANHQATIGPTISTSINSPTQAPTKAVSGVRISKNLKASYKNALQQIELKRYFKKLSFAEKVVVWMSVAFEFICSILHLRIRGKGIKVGFQELELGIPLHALVTVFGELIFNKTTQRMTMPKPEYFFNNKVRLMNDIQSRIANKRILVVLLCVPLVLSSCYLYKFLVNRIRVWIRRQQRINQDKLKQLNFLEVNELSCAQCKENVRSIIFRPCEHMTHCKVCFDTLTEDHPNEAKVYPDCSVCKARVTSIVEVFVS